MYNYEKYLEGLSHKPCGILTPQENVLSRIYLDWKDRVEKDNILLVGFIDIENLVTFIISKEKLEDFKI